MIFYIASYPRSGNFWLQTLLGNQFKRPTTNIHVAIESTVKSRLRSMNSVKRLYDIEPFELSVSQLEDYPSELSGWMLGYKVDRVDEDGRFLVHGCKDVVNNLEIRKALAEDNHYYFLKTHFGPYPEYLPGEYVIQIVRNPGAVIWSYYNFKRDVRKREERKLSTIIQEDGYGNWSQYHQKWIDAAKELGPRYFLVRYEELASGELEFCDNLSSFLKLPILSKELRSFEYYHQLRPSLTRKGKAGGWEENYSKNQLGLLWRIHGQLMNYYGYPEPQYDLGLEAPLY